MNAIFKRRSIRQYTGEPVSNEQIKQILKAGMAAPSAHNQQPYRFVVIKSREKLNEMASFHPYAKMLTEAAFGMLVYYNINGLKSPDFVIQDCSAAIQNMLIQSTDMGIGSVWIGVNPKKELMERVAAVCGLKEGEVPMSLISFGIPAFEKEPVDRYDSSWVREI